MEVVWWLRRQRSGLVIKRLSCSRWNFFFCLLGCFKNLWYLPPRKWCICLHIHVLMNNHGCIVPIPSPCRPRCWTCLMLAPSENWVSVMSLRLNLAGISLGLQILTHLGKIEQKLQVHFWVLFALEQRDWKCGCSGLPIWKRLLYHSTNSPLQWKNNCIWSVKLCLTHVREKHGGIKKTFFCHFAFHIAL